MFLTVLNYKSTFELMRHIKLNNFHFYINLDLIININSSKFHLIKAIWSGWMSFETKILNFNHIMIVYLMYLNS